jgi:hypothetical protein
MLNREIGNWDFTSPVTAASSTGQCNTIQCIDSTLLAWKNHLFGCARSKPSQRSVPPGLTLASGSSFCSQCVVGFSSVLRRPIEITAFIRHWGDGSLSTAGTGYRGSARM